MSPTPHDNTVSGAEALANRPRFDPSRISEHLASVEGSLLAPLVRKAADDFYEAVMGSAEDYLRDNLDSNLSSHLAMLERQNARMRRELYEIDQLISPPGADHEGRLQRLRDMDRANVELIALRDRIAFGVQS